MESVREFLSFSWTNSFIVGIPLPFIMSPLLFVPVSAFLTKRKRSINRNLYEKLPDDYWFVTCRALTIVGVSSALLLGWMARSPRVMWTGASLQNTVGSFLLVFILREFINYWLHRFSHSKLLYKAIHAGHHAIAHTGSGSFDGIYGYPGDSVIGMIGLYSPFYFVHEIHVSAIIMFLLFFGIFGLMLNHCGREFIVALKLPWIGRVVLYDNSHHDDHHVYRHGNYCDFIPFFDWVFGTDLVIPHEQRRPLPAVTNWAKVRNHVIGQPGNEIDQDSDAEPLTQEEQAKIAALSNTMAKGMKAVKGTPYSTEKRRRSTILTESFSALRRFSSMLLEEHPDCKPDPSAHDFCGQVVERRKSHAFSFVKLSSPEGHLLATHQKEE